MNPGRKGSCTTEPDAKAASSLILRWGNQKMQQFRCSPHLRLKPELLGVALLRELCGISANFAVKIFPCVRCQQEAFNR
jgi:hypothetical protein